MCKWLDIICTAPDTFCPYWQGIFCELDEAFYAEYKDLIDFNNS